MITKDGNSDRKLETMVGQDLKGDLMHINMSEAAGNVDDKLSEFGPEAGQPPETIEEKIADWAHDVGGSDEKADEILGQDDRHVKHTADMAEKVMDVPEGLDTLVDPLALQEGASPAPMHVVEFDED